MPYAAPSRPSSALSLVFACLALLAPAMAPPLAAATPSDHLLVPYFEVDLDGRGLTTLVALGNHGDRPVAVDAVVTSDWGIPLLAERLTVPAAGVVTLNLRDWLVAGRLPSRVLPRAEREHLAAALSGRPSPADGLLYGSAGDGTRAVGAITLRLAAGTERSRPRVLWGDVLWVDPRADRAEGGRLVDLGAGGQALCDHHLLRFLTDGELPGGTELVVWSGRRRPATAPSGASASTAEGTQIAIGSFHRESGEGLGLRELDLPPVAAVDLGTLGLDETSGWLDLMSDGPVYAAVRYRGADRYAVGLETWCRSPIAAGLGTPGISLETLVEGEDADAPPGAILEARQPVTWTYVVTNVGGVTLGGVRVVDRPGGPVACPRRVLEPGETMICTKRGRAIDGGFFDQVGVVTATAPDGSTVSASDPGFYYVPRPFVPE